MAATTVGAAGALHWGRLDFARQKIGNSLIEIAFTGNHTKNAALPESLLQATADTPGNQHIDLIQGMRLPVLGFVKRLFDTQFKQAPTDNAPLFNVIDPELAALARVFGNCLAILATHGNPERVAERRHVHRLTLRCTTAATATTMRMRMAMRVPGTRSMTATTAMPAQRTG